jgi:3,4-dihydroxy 2-butanone 4-phosphate synthase/GTP cyclohydrolase II
MGRGHLTYLGYGNLGKKVCFSFKRDGRGRARASLISGEGDVLSYPNDNVVSGQDKFVNQSPAIELQPDATGFGTLSAEITPTTAGFLAANDEYDLDRPTEGFASIPEAIEDIRQGKVHPLDLLFNFWGLASMLRSYIITSKALCY